MICLIGMGPGELRYVTQDAVETIKTCERVVAFGRIARTAEKIKKTVIKVDKVSQVIDNIQEDKDTAILASGDPGFYGVLDYLKDHGVRIDRVLPGISSLQYMMAKLQKSWHNACFVSLHGRKENFKEIIKNPLSVILTDFQYTPSLISQELWELGCRGTTYTGFNLSYEDERIITKKIGEPIEDISSLSLVVIENEMD